MKQPFEYLAHRFFQQVGETVEARRPIGDEARQRWAALGQELAKKLG